MEDQTTVGVGEVLVAGVPPGNVQAYVAPDSAASKLTLKVVGGFMELTVKADVGTGLTTIGLVGLLKSSEQAPD